MIAELIKPFTWYGEEIEEYYSVSLNVEAYKYEIMDNGDNWTALAIVFLKEVMPELLHDITFDSGRDMFHVTTTDNSLFPKEELEEFILKFKETCENETLFNDLLSKTQLVSNKEVFDFMNECAKQMNEGKMIYDEMRNLFSEKYMKRLEK